MSLIAIGTASQITAGANIELAEGKFNQAEQHLEEAMELSGDLGLIQADPLICYMIEQGNISGSLKVRAHYAFVQGEIERSVELLESAESTEKDDWAEADAKTLAQYRGALDD